MEGPPLGPGGEDITWPDQVDPRGRKACSTRKIKSQTSNLIPLVVIPQLSHPYTSTTRGRASAPWRSGTVSQSRSQGRAPPALALAPLAASVPAAPAPRPAPPPPRQRPSAPAPPSARGGADWC